MVVEAVRRTEEEATRRRRRNIQKAESEALAAIFARKALESTTIGKNVGGLHYKDRFPCRSRQTTT
jgi:hypothetical protein